MLSTSKDCSGKGGFKASRFASRFPSRFHKVHKVHKVQLQALI